MNMNARKSASTPATPAYDYQNRRPAEIVRDLIARAGFSQRQAARELGVDEREMRYWCSGDRDPPRMAILALERLVDLGRQVTSK